MRSPVLDKAFVVYRRLISPMIHAAAGPGYGCRFYPTCGDYAREAIQRRGLLKGIALVGRRVSRCHPWGSSGFDPVP